MKTVDCGCGGHALVECRGDIVRVICEDCGKYIATAPERGETEREQMKRACFLWNAEQGDKGKRI